MMIAQIHMLEFQRKSNYWYKNGRECNARGKCLFFELCQYGTIPGVMGNFRNKTAHHEELQEVNV
jgi:hypothetical protein